MRRSKVLDTQRLVLCQSSSSNNCSNIESNFPTKTAPFRNISHIATSSNTFSNGKSAIQHQEPFCGNMTPKDEWASYNANAVARSSTLKISSTIIVLADETHNQCRPDQSESISDRTYGTNKTSPVFQKKKASSLKPPSSAEASSFYLLGMYQLLLIFLPVHFLLPRIFCHFACLRRFQRYSFLAKADAGWRVFFPCTDSSFDLQLK